MLCYGQQAGWKLYRNRRKGKENRVKDERGLSEGRRDEEVKRDCMERVETEEKTREKEGNNGICGKSVLFVGRGKYQEIHI